jgi:hypothetical protein
MKEAITILVTYGTVSKKNLGIYLVVLWIVLTFVTLQDSDTVTFRFLPSVIILGILSSLFLLRVLVDLYHTKKLSVDVGSSSKIIAATQYLERLNKRSLKIYKRNKNESDYTKFIDAYKMVNNHLKKMELGDADHEY